MPQPANSRARRPSSSAQRSAIPNSPLPCASTQPTGPAYRPRSICSSSRISSSAVSAGVPHTAAGGCSVPASDSTERSRAQSAPDGGAQVVYVGQLEQRGAGRNVELGAQRRERVPHRGDRVGVLLGVLGRGEQGGPERGVFGGLAAPGRGPAQDQRRDLAALPPDQKFGGSADQVRAREREAVRVPGGQPAQQDARVDRAGRGREHVAGQHDLAQGPGGDPADRDRDGVRPFQCGQASVVPAQARRGGARVGQIAWIGAGAPNPVGVPG